MDQHDQWFTPKNVEEQIEHHTHIPDQSSVNGRMLHDLQFLVEDDGRRLAAIRERLVEHARGNIQREPIQLQRYHNADILPQRLELHRAKKQSSFLIRVLSGVAAVLVIVSTLLAFTFFASHSKLQHINSPTPGISLKPIVSQKATFLLDATTGSVLVAVNSHEHHPIARMAQIMTAVVALENTDPSQFVTIEQATIDTVPKGASVAQLLVGDRLQIRDLVAALLLSSGDDAALVIARAVGGNTQNFVTMMNDEAHQLQLGDTHFVDPYGSASANNYSSAADLTRLASYALQLSDIAQVFTQGKYAVAASVYTHSYLWSQSKSFLIAPPSGLTSLRANSSAATGASLVFSFQQNDHLFIGTELKAPSEMLLSNDVRMLLEKRKP